MKGMSAVSTLSSLARSLPTLRFAATWPLTWASQPPSAASIDRVSSSRVCSVCRNANSDYLQVWIDVLLEGTPRRRARPRRTTFARLASIRPFLAETAFHYSTLRQVTPDDVTGWLDGRKHQANDASALRDLFRTLKSKRLVFTNPTDRVRVVKPNQTTPNRQHGRVHPGTGRRRCPRSARPGPTPIGSGCRRSRRP